MGREGERRGEIGDGERASENEKGGENERRTEWRMWTYRFKEELLLPEERED